jgi:hypothetical protein
VQFDYGDEVLFNFADKASEGGKYSPNDPGDRRTGGLVRMPKRPDLASKPSLKVGAKSSHRGPLTHPNAPNLLKAELFSWSSNCSNPIL